MRKTPIFSKHSKAPEGRARGRGRRSLALRQALCVVLVLVVLAILPVFVNHPIGYIPLGFYLLLLLGCWLYLRVITKGFSLEYGETAGSCPRTGSVLLPIEMKNASRLPILRAETELFVSNPCGEIDYETRGLALVDAGGANPMRAQVNLAHVGVYHAGVKGVVLYDPLMFFHAHVSAEGDVSIASVPHVVDVKSRELSELALHESHRPVRTVLSDDIDYAGTREYAYGDPLKTVHWKLSARTGELQTRLFEMSVNSRLVVIMGFTGYEYTADELLTCGDVVVETALTILRLAQSRAIEACVKYVGAMGGAMSCGLPDDAELAGFVASLPVVSPQLDEGGTIALLDSELRVREGASNIVICAAALTDALVSHLRAAACGKANISLLLAMPEGRKRAFYRQTRSIVSEFSSMGVSFELVSDVSEFEEA